MNRILTLLCALALIAGCGGNGGGDQTQADHEAATQATEGSAALVAPASYDGAESVTLEGSLGCGHCTHHMGTGCSAALQTADGTVYILDGMNQGDAPFDKRFDGLTLKVVGKTAVNEGTHFVKVESYEEL